MRPELILAIQGMNQRKGHEEVQRRTSPIIEWASMAGWTWGQIQFGWTTAGVVAGHVRILAGDIVKATFTPVTVAQTDIALTNGVNTYVGLECSRRMTGGAIISSSSKPVTDNSYVRFWFYIFRNTDDSVSLKKANLGQVMNVDITAYGDD